jgi:hypothetical protein
MKQTNRVGIWVFLAIAGVFAAVIVRMAVAIPSGGSVSYMFNSTSNGSVPGSRADFGGYIHTVNIDTLQQDTNWKAYIGNVTGSFTLDDAVNKTIYSWDMAVTGGEIYASHNTSITWSQIGCAGPQNITEENAFFGFSPGGSDNINSTFNTSLHSAFFVGSRSFQASQCNATALYINDTRQVVAADSRWQEILLNDNASMVYTAIMREDLYGYNNLTYDFQLILPENGTQATPTTYYFWVELG